VPADTVVLEDTGSGAGGRSLPVARCQLVPTPCTVSMEVLGLGLM